MSSTTQVFTWIDNDHLSMIMVLFGCVIYNFGFIYVNEMKIHPITTALSRGIVLSSLSYLLARKFSTQITYKSPYLIKWLVIRSSIMILQGLAFATVQFYLPQPIAITINASPPIFVSIIDYFLNGIIMNRLQIVFLFVSLLGVTLTINGSYLITFLDKDFTYDESKFKNYHSDDPSVMMMAGIVYAFVIIIYAYGIVITKKLVGVNGIQLNFVTGILTMISSGLLFPLTLEQQSYNTPTLPIFLKSIIYAGSLMAIGQLSFNGALTLTKNFGLVTTLSFSSIIFGYMVSVIRYSQPINPICTIGALIIIIGIIFIIKFKQQNTAK